MKLIKIANLMALMGVTLVFVSCSSGLKKNASHNQLIKNFNPESAQEQGQTQPQTQMPVTADRPQQRTVSSVHPCQSYLKAFNRYDEYVGREIVYKISIFDLMDWSVHSDFQGLVAVKEVPEGAKLNLSWAPHDKPKLVTKKVIGRVTRDFLIEDENYRLIQIPLEKLLNDQTKMGHLYIRLSFEEQILCEDSFSTFEMD